MKSKGMHYEELALDYLKRAGLKLICRNFNCKQGEIDLIMREKTTLVFVEVRYRNNKNYGSAAESVNANKQRKLVKAASIYLSKHKLWNTECRFDVVALSHTPAATSKTQIDWIKSAFYT